MGKLLRVLVVILLILSAGALTLGIMLFQKRELLKGRTQKLENTVVALGTAIEAQDPESKDASDLPAKDASECKAEVLDTPELSDFWDNYKYELESQDVPTLDLSADRRQLMVYYQIDPETGKIKLNDLGYKSTEGEGTMQEVLSKLMTKAEEQHGRLNATRQQLTNLRIELVNTIEELNSRKKQLRSSLVEIEQLNAEISRLNAEIRSMKDQIAELEEEKRSLEDQIAQQKRDMALLQEQVAEKDIEIERLNNELKKYLTTSKPDSGSRVGQEQPAMEYGDIETGVKGTVVAINPEWNFVAVALSQQSLQELAPDPTQPPRVGVELMVKRGETFVTKVRVMQVRRDEGLAIADILSSWQQMPVQEGDVVFF